MRSPKRLHDDMMFVAEFGMLLDVMQQAALSQLRRLDEAQGQQSLLSGRLRSELWRGLPLSAAAHPLVAGGATGNALIVMTSDQGFVGPLYASVMREAQRHADPDTRWFFIGQRGARLHAPTMRIEQVMPMPDAEASGALVRELAATVVARYLHAGWRDVWVAAPRYYSPTRQGIWAERLLPLPMHRTSAAPADEAVTLEPSVDRALAASAAVWVAAVLSECLWSGRRAECAARALHLDSARQELSKHNVALRLERFKAMHERLDVMVRETSVVQRQLARTRRTVPPMARPRAGARA